MTKYQNKWTLDIYEFVKQNGNEVTLRQPNGREFIISTGELNFTYRKVKENK